MKKKSKTKTIKLDPSIYFKKAETPSKLLRNAAKKSAKEIKKHFKEDGWDLDYSLLVTDIFYIAFSHNLENYLWSELIRQKVSVTLDYSDKKTNLVLRKAKK